MSFVIAAPEYLTAAVSDLANIGSSISSANTAALAPTMGVLPAGADEVSAAIAALFGSHAQAYQALSAQAASFHSQFVALMNGGAAQYAMTEAANATPWQTVEHDLLGAVNAPTQALVGRPLIGNGPNAAPGSGANGAPGGILIGNGGAGGSGSISHPTGGNGGAAGLFGNGGPGAPAISPTTAAMAGPADCSALAGPAGRAGPAAEASPEPAAMAGLPGCSAPAARAAPAAFPVPPALPPGPAALVAVAA
jgi:PE family